MTRAALLFLAGLAAGCVYDMSRPRHESEADRALDRPPSGEPALDGPRPGLPDTDARKSERAKLADYRREAAPDKAWTADQASPACQSGMATFAKSAGGITLVVCDTGPMGNAQSHCNASGLCASPWKLCTPAEYTQIIPTTLPFPQEAQGAWLSGNARCGTNNTLDPGLCLNCTDCGEGVPGVQDIGFDCTTGTVLTSTPCNYVGLQAAAGCQQVNGVSGLWLPTETKATSHRSLCCK